MNPRTVEDTHRFIEKAAAHNGWHANPDNQFRTTIAEGLTTNFNRHGYYLCPCRDGEGIRKVDRDIICPCVYAGADIAQYGQCFCGLFLSPETARKENFTLSQIPERRPSDR